MYFHICNLHRLKANCFCFNKTVTDLRYCNITSKTWSHEVKKAQQLGKMQTYTNIGFAIIVITNANGINFGLWASQLISTTKRKKGSQHTVDLKPPPNKFIVLPSPFKIEEETKSKSALSRHVLYLKHGCFSKLKSFRDAEIFCLVHVVARFIPKMQGRSQNKVPADKWGKKLGSGIFCKSRKYYSVGS